MRVPQCEPLFFCFSSLSLPVFRRKSAAILLIEIVKVFCGGFFIFVKSLSLDYHAYANKSIVHDVFEYTFCTTTLMYGTYNRCICMSYKFFTTLCKSTQYAN